jgi:hypothetical protein
MRFVDDKTALNHHGLADGKIYIKNLPNLIDKTRLCTCLANENNKKATTEAVKKQSTRHCPPLSA